jgi:tetratricopeptide (TPR) repeat protein
MMKDLFFFLRVLWESWRPQHPTPPLAPERAALQEAFFVARERGDRAAAEAAGRQLVALNDSLMHRAQDAGYLADVLEERGRYDEAFLLVQAATQAARKSKITPLLPMALRKEVDIATRCGKYAHAQACIAEGLRCVAQADIPMPWAQAEFLMRRARLHLEAGDLAQAIQDLKTAEKPLFSASSDGILPRQRLWYQVTAKLRLAQGDSQGALAAGNEALVLARRIAQFQHLDSHQRRTGLTRSLLLFAELQESLGNTEAAEAARQEASAIE